MIEDRDTGAGKDGGGHTDKYEAHVIGSFEQLDKLLRTFNVDVGCTRPHFRRIDDLTADLLIYADLGLVERLKGQGYTVELGDNVSQRAEKLKGEIGTGDRFDGGRVVPHGFGVNRSQGGAHGKDPQRQ